MELLPTIAKGASHQASRVPLAKGAPLAVASSVVVFEARKLPFWGSFERETKKNH